MTQIQRKWFTLKLLLPWVLCHYRNSISHTKFREHRNLRPTNNRKQLRLQLGMKHKVIQKMFKSKQMMFISGSQGLQAKHAKAIEIHFQLVLQNGRHSIDASQWAAEADGFATQSGGQEVWGWTKVYVSHQGHHATILCSQIQILQWSFEYMCLNKWAMDLSKLNKFTKNRLVPQAADKYLCSIVENEMPWGLKKYMDVQLFPCIHLKPGHGISLSTANHWLCHEGFKYTTHKKGLYFDGHNWPDVVEYWQNVFLLAMKALKPQLVQYEIWDVKKEMIIQQANYVKCQLIFMPQDEMTLKEMKSCQRYGLFGTI